MKTLMHYWSDQEAVTTVEYALLLGLIVMVGILAWSTLGTSLADSAQHSTELLMPDEGEPVAPPAKPPPAKPPIM